VEVDLDKGVVRNITSGAELTVKPLPPFMQKLLQEGGIVKYLENTES